MVSQTQPSRPIRPPARPLSAQAQPRPQSPPPQKKNSWLPYALLGGLALGGSTMMALIVAVVVLFVFSADRIPNRVTVSGIDLGGQRAAEAETTLQQNFGSASVTLRDGERSQQVALDDLGISVDIAATVEKAQQATPGSNITPAYYVDLVKAQNALIDLSETFNVEPVYDPPQMGRALEIPVMLDQLRLDPSVVADGVLDMAMIEVALPEPDELTVENYGGAKTTHIVERGQELGLIAKQYNVPLDAIVSMNDISDPDLLFIGQELVIPAAGEYVPSAAEAPAPSTNSGKAIVVSVGTQRIYAYENGQLLRSHLVSTGLPQTPTVLGDYSIYVRYLADDMSGPGYFLPQVPHAMYFFQGYAIHGTYWHNNFGRQMSHGCVNLPVDESEWFYNWAQVGTPVRVVA